MAKTVCKKIRTGFVVNNEGDCIRRFDDEDVLVRAGLCELAVIPNSDQWNFQIRVL